MTARAKEVILPAVLRQARRDRSHPTNGAACGSARSFSRIRCGIPPDPAGNQKNFSANFSVGEGSSIQDGLRKLTVNAVDLAGNYILALTPAEKIINPNSEITRNNSGIMQGSGGASLGDRSVDFIRPNLFPVVV